jgi:hypothetical protein
MAVTSFISAQNAQQRIAMEEINSSPLILFIFKNVEEGRRQWFDPSTGSGRRFAHQPGRRQKVQYIRGFNTVLNWGHQILNLVRRFTLS